MLAQHECLFVAFVQPQWIAFAQIDAIMRGAKVLNDFRFRVSRANPLGEAPPARRAIAPLRQHDPGGLKQPRRPRHIIFQVSIEHEHQGTLRERAVPECVNGSIV